MEPSEFTIQDFRLAFEMPDSAATKTVYNQVRRLGLQCARLAAVDHVKFFALLAKYSALSDRKQVRVKLDDAEAAERIAAAKRLRDRPPGEPLGLCPPEPVRLNGR